MPGGAALQHLRSCRNFVRRTTGVMAALLLLAQPLSVRAQESAPATASSGPSLSQTGVPAEATAENGVQARERAFASARRIAWQRLAAEAGISPGNPSDSQLEGMVRSIVIEQERTSPTRYSGRVTVNFRPGLVRGARSSGDVAGAGTSSGTPRPASERPISAASTYIDATATYRSLGEWLELQRRLRTAAPVASVDVTGIAVDAARLRIGVRGAPPVAAGDLAGLGIAVQPVAGTGAVEAWRVGLAGGG